MSPRVHFLGIAAAIFLAKGMDPDVATVFGWIFIAWTWLEARK